MVESARLESVFALTGNEGSNPSLSARFFFPFHHLHFFESPTVNTEGFVCPENGTKMEHDMRSGAVVTVTRRLAGSGIRLRSAQKTRARSESDQAFAPAS